MLRRSFAVQMRLTAKCLTNGHGFGTMAFAQPRLVFAEDDIQHPVQAVLDAPMSAHGFLVLLSHELPDSLTPDF